MGEGQSKQQAIGSGLALSNGATPLEKKEVKDSMKLFSQGELLLLDSMFRDLAARSPGKIRLVLFHVCVIERERLLASRQERLQNPP